MFSKLDRKVSSQYLFLLIITVIAAALRFYRLGEWSMWIEEHHSLRHAMDADFSLKTLVTNRMPFYLAIKLIVSQLGTSEWAARILPAVIGTATVPLLFLFVRKLLGFRLALFASVFLAISPWHLYWSQNTRFYTLLLVTYSVSLFSFYWGIEKDRFGYILLSVAGLAVSGALHLVSALLIPVFVLYYLALKLLSWEKPAGLRFRNLLPVIGLPFIGFAVLEAVNFFYLGERPLLYTFYLKSVNRSTAGFAGLPHPYAMLTAVVYYLGTPGAFLGVLGGAYLLKNKERIGILLSLGSMFPLALLSLMTLFASTSNRYAFMTLACWVILAAVAVNGVLTRWRTNDKMVFLVLAGIVGLMLRDPVVEDVVYYSQRVLGFRLIVLAMLASTLLGLLVVSRFGTRTNAPSLVNTALILLIALFHPLLTDAMYYRFQHGHRDNVKASAATIKSERVEGEAVFASPPSPLDYYLGQTVLNPKKVRLDKLQELPQRFWLIDSTGVNDSFRDRVEESCDCELRGSFDVYTAGRYWKNRVYVCQPNRGESDPDRLHRKTSTGELVGTPKDSFLSKGSP